MLWKKLYQSQVCFELKFEAWILISFHFAGNESKQIWWPGYFGRGKFGHGNLIKVKDLQSSLAAIDEIVREGEGAQPCNPTAFKEGNVRDFAHYYLFESIVEEREVRFCKKLHEV